MFYYVHLLVIYVVTVLPYFTLNTETSFIRNVVMCVQCALRLITVTVMLCYNA